MERLPYSHSPRRSRQSTSSVKIDPVAAAAAIAQLHTRSQLSDPTPSAEEPLRLDPKGATYLSWIADGKTMEEVADLEGVKYTERS